jgi:hypothetical protein
MWLIVHLHKIIRNNISEQLATSIFRVVLEGHKSRTIYSDAVDFRLSPRCRWDLRFSEILHSLEWWFRTDVSGKPIDPFFKGKDGADKLSRSVITESSLYAAQYLGTAKISTKKLVKIGALHATFLWSLCFTHHLKSLSGGLSPN